MKTAILVLCTFAPSWLRLVVWRMFGFRVGRNCRVSIFSVVVANSIELESGCIISPLSFICRPSVLRMGERSRIASFVRIIGWKGEIVLAPQTFIAMACLIDSSGDVSIGARSQIGPRSILYTHGATGLIHNMRYPQRIGAIRIGEDVWIGMQTTIPPRVSIGDGVIVLPGMIVRQDIPAGKAVLPTQSPEYKLLPTRCLLIQVTDDVQRECVQTMFLELVDSLKMTTTSQDDWVWKANARNGNSLYLLLDSTAGLDVRFRAGSVVWTLDRDCSIPGVPTFCFPQLTVFGERTPFAEKIAYHLCASSGSHFVFSDAQS